MNINYIITNIMDKEIIQVDVDKIIHKLTTDKQFKDPKLS